MGQITVKEKEHWKDRIGRKVEKAIETLINQEDPGYLARTRNKAKQLAYQSLQLEDLMNQRDEATKQEEVLTTQKKRLVQAMVTAVTGKTVEEQSCGYYGGSSIPNEVTAAVSRRQRVHEEELMEANSLGKQILILRREQEELLDTVWLATSGAQIKELWQRVNDLLGQPPTPLQAKALALTPVAEE